MRLALDPGHGMGNVSPGRHDPGAVAAGFRESEIALQWALAGRFVLAQYGVEVSLTRSNESVETPLSARVRRASAAGATHLISIHCNAGGGTGVETFFRTPVQRRFALRVQQVLVEATGLRDRGVKHEAQTKVGRLAVLDFPIAALIEIGFIDNAQDRAVMLARDVRIGFWTKFAKRFQLGGQ